MVARLRGTKENPFSSAEMERRSSRLDDDDDDKEHVALVRCTYRMA